VSAVPCRLSLCPEGGGYAEEDQDACRFEERDEILPACHLLGHRDSIVLQAISLEEL
jgi:hypothetical protein